MINGRYLILLSMLFTSACSTVERRTYYSPNVDASNSNGPERPYCGFTNFGGLPDSYSSDSTLGTITITTDQNYHPYLWGPWFLTVVPVFPITWLVEPFIDDNLQISLEIQNEKLVNIPTLEFKASYDDTILEPSNIHTFDGYGDVHYHVTFPVDYDDIDSFKILVTYNENEISIPFTKAGRWSWTQWTPNC